MGMVPFNVCMFIQENIAIAQAPIHFRQIFRPLKSRVPEPEKHLECL